MSNLPRPGDPLVTGLGKIVEDQDVAQTGAVTADEYTERTTIVAFDQFKPHKEITRNDLPAGEEEDQKQASIVVGLRLIGLSFQDIAEVLRVPIHVVNDIAATQGTRHTFNAAVRNIINANSDSIQGRISSYANSAVTTVVGLMEDKETRADVRLKAAQDVLDRSGTNADQFFAADKADNHSDDELKIVMMEDENDKPSVSINIKRKG